MSPARTSKLLWITRTAPFCHRSASLFRNDGYRALVAPVLQIRPLAVRRPERRPDALAFTSAQGVRHHPYDRSWRDLPLFAVGDHTAEAAMAAGYADVRSAAGCVTDLQRLIASSLAPRSRIFAFGAREVAGDMDRVLARKGFDVERFAVYEAFPSPRSEFRETLESLPRIDGICVYSPKAAQGVAELLADSGWRGTIFCISEACASHLPVSSSILVEIAERPDERALLETVRRRWSDAVVRAAYPPNLDLRRIRSLAGAPDGTANDNQLVHSPGSRRDPEGEDPDPPPSAA